MNKFIFYSSLFFIPLAIILTVSQIVIFDTDYYLEQYEELNVTDSSLLDNISLEAETNNILGYVSGQNNLSSTFNEKETAHMVDVKSLFQKGFGLRRFSFFVSIILLLIIATRKDDKNNFSPVQKKKNLKDISKILIYSSLVTIIALILLSLSFLNFSNLFIAAHEIVFDNTNWDLNSNVDVMINMFPLQFFINIMRKIIITSIILSTIILLIGLILKYRDEIKSCLKKHKNK